jgi:hypothetical protein
LGVSIDSDELDPHHVRLDHSIDRVAAPASNTDDSDLGEAFYLVISNW